MYYPYLQNPYMQNNINGYQPITPPPVTQQQPQNPSSNVIWVRNEAEARNYPVAAGNTVMLMDNDNPVAYKKTADLSGRSMPLEIYDLVRREPAEPHEENHQINLEEYLTRKEFDTYATEINKRLSEMEDEPDYEEIEEEEEEIKPVRRRRTRKNA